MPWYLKLGHHSAGQYFSPLAVDEVRQVGLFVAVLFLDRIHVRSGTRQNVGMRAQFKW